MDETTPKLCKFIEHGVIRDLSPEEAEGLLDLGLIFRCKTCHTRHVPDAEVFHLAPKSDIQMVLNELRHMRDNKQILH